MDNFVHLHVHGETSVLDGAAKFEDMAARVKKLGQPALALTDHGNLYGAYNFYQEMTKAGIKPIIGIEAYISPLHHTHKEPVFLGTPDENGKYKNDIGGRGAYTHMTLLAKNATGLRNLYKLQTLSFTEGFYYKGRMSLEMIDEYGDGLIATTGCAGSYISTALRLGRPDVAASHLDSLKDIFGSDLYVEVMSHGITVNEDGTDGFDEEGLNRSLINLASTRGVHLVATNDSHYVSESDSEVHDALLCVQTRTKVADTNRFRFSGSGYHIKSRLEMSKTGLPVEALDRTVQIASEVESYAEVFEHRLRMPTGGGISVLRARTMDSARVKGNPEYLGRAEYELSVIESSGFADYFIILADTIAEEKSLGNVVGPGRGSAGGSLVAYSLGITDIDPIAHGLLFERFLNPERVSLPDIDVDLEDRKRDAFIGRLQARYGVDKVAQLMTLGTVGAKAALKDATRVLGYPYVMGEKLVSYLPPAVFGTPPPLSKMSPVESPEHKRVVALARGLEGLVRNVGVHASGVVISPVPMHEVLPLWKQVGKDVLITGFDAKPTEALGLVKMDYLGLRTNTVISQTLEYLGLPNTHLLDIPLDDPKVYEMLTAGHSEGVFQLDSDGMKRMMRSVKPTEFEHIAAVMALYRPGPMGAKSHDQYAIRKNKKGVSQSPSIHPDLDDILEPLLKETYGLIVYQEQVMAVLREVCGWSLGKADIVRKAMGKKDHDVLASVLPDFESSMESNGHSKDASEALWAVLLPFADYAFNKSHSVGYGLVSYWTAYLKANHPIEYMTSLLTSVAEDPKRLPGYLEETKRMGIKLLPPDVNQSDVGFTPTKDGIRYGLLGIKGFGENAYKALNKTRPFKDINDFYNRAPSTVLNAGVLRSLQSSGALDSIEPRRIGLVGRSEEMATKALEDRKNRSTGRVGLFRKSYSALAEAIEDARQYRAWEVEYLGIALTGDHMLVTLKRPLDEAEWDYLAKILVNCPGDSSVEIEYQGSRIVSQERVDLDSVRSSLDNLKMLELFYGTADQATGQD